METTRLIEQYLDGSISDEDRLFIDQKLNSDKEFGKLVELYKEVNESIADKKLKALRELLVAIDLEYAGKKNQSVVENQKVKLHIQRKIFLRVAAIMLFIVCSGIAVKFLFFKEISNEDLFRKYYTSYESDIVSRSAQSGEVILEEAILNYNNKEYEQALNRLNNLVNYNNENYLAWFYRGLTFLETNKTEDALDSFRRIPESWESPYQEHRNWYMALSLLRLGEKTVAASEFERIKRENGFYAEKARDILNEIKI